MSFDLKLAIASLAIGYVLGSLPFGYLVAKANGVNIFKVGSRSPGATNVKRSVGARAGNIVFALDFGKGVGATVWPGWIYIGGGGYLYALLGLVAAVLGHSYSVFTRFRGGKGVATMLGGVVALMPIAALVAILVWLAVFYSTRYVSIASICLALSLPVTNVATGEPVTMIWVSAALAVVIVFRHRTNIVRLLRGEENRFSRDTPARKRGPSNEVPKE